MPDVSDSASTKKHSLVLSPIQIGQHELRNRVFVSAHTTNFGTADHLVSDRHVHYHLERARGGVALIFSEGVRVHPMSERPYRVGAYSESQVPGWRRLAEAIHSEGAVLFAQLFDPGRHLGNDATAGWSASNVPWLEGAPIPHVMTSYEIADLGKAFGTAAGRIGRAGLDGIEIHLGHGHLLHQFLSPASNSRDDRYGGGVEGRVRLPIDILRVIRERINSTLALGIRVSGDDFHANGLHVDDILEVCSLIEAEVELDFINVSQSAYVGGYSLSTQIPDSHFGSAPFTYLAERFKSAFPATPIMSVGRIDDLDVAEDVLQRGQADMVGMTRAHISDPHIIKKRWAGEATRSCIACNEGCVGQTERNLPLGCVVNPRVGAEEAWKTLEGATRPPRRTVLVVGGGPSGLQAAVEAARFGHKVRLVESSERLGGQVRLIAATPGRERFGLLISELEAEARIHGVEIELGAPASAADISGDSWDCVVLATGSRQLEERIPGSEERFVTPDDAIRDPSVFRGGVLIVDRRGDWVAGTVAERLLAAGMKVVGIVSPLDGLFPNITKFSRFGLFQRLKEAGVRSWIGWDVGR